MSQGVRRSGLTDFVEGSPLTRRKLLGVAGATTGAFMAGSVLAACGGGGGTTAATSGGESGGALGTLDIYTWEGYDLQKEMAAWRAKNGVKLRANYIGIQDDVSTRLTSPAAKGIDLSSANQSFINFFKELGIMSPITVEEVPALKELYPRFQGPPWREEDGTFNSVPWTWGPLGLTYNAESIEAPESWDILFDPSMKGRITLLDDPQQCPQLASAILGYNPDQLTMSQLDDVKDFLTRLLGQAKTLTATTGDQVALMEEGEIDLVFLGWTGIDVAAAEKGFKAITVVPPRGGKSIGFSDASFVPPDADNREGAIAFSEQLITGKIAAAAAESFFAAVTNPKVVPLLDKKTRDAYPYDDIDSYFDLLLFPLGYPRDEESEYATLDQVVQAWEEVKASAL